MQIRRKTIPNASLDRAPCPTCKREQNYGVLSGLEERVISKNHFVESTVKRYFVLECKGCNTSFFALEEISVFGEPNDLILAEAYSKWTFNPPLEWRDKPEWFSTSIRRKHKQLYDLMSDTYDAANREANVLAAMGIRTCFDLVSDVLNVDASLPFAEKIEVIRKSGHISPREKSVLELLVDAGSAAAHRSWRPSKRDLATLFDALETFIQHAIILPQGLDTLNRRVPKRSPPKK